VCLLPEIRIFWQSNLTKLLARTLCLRKIKLQVLLSFLFLLIKILCLQLHRPLAQCSGLVWRPQLSMSDCRTNYLLHNKPKIGRQIKTSNSMLMTRISHQMYATRLSHLLFVDHHESPARSQPMSNLMSKTPQTSPALSDHLFHLLLKMDFVPIFKMAVHTNTFDLLIEFLPLEALAASVFPQWHPPC
jgi:hypothetical protein